MEKIQISQQHNYFIEKPNEVRFLDPVLGVELTADEPPPSLFENELTARGIKYLHELSAQKRITIQLVQAAHGGMEDFLDIEREFGDVLRNAPVAGIEIDWRPKITSLDPPVLSSIDYIFSSNSGQRAFQEKQLSWLKEHNKLALPCEYPDSSGYENALSRSLENLIELYVQENNRGNSRGVLALMGSYQVCRQWIFITQLGYWLWQLDQNNQLPLVDLNIPFMSGSLHTALEQKIARYFRIPVEYYVVANRTLGALPVDPFDDVFIGMTTHARATYEQLETLFSF